MPVSMKRSVESQELTRQPSIINKYYYYYYYYKYMKGLKQGQRIKELYFVWPNRIFQKNTFTRKMYLSKSKILNNAHININKIKIIMLHLK